MRKISSSKIIEKVSSLVVKTNRAIRGEVREAIEKTFRAETAPLSKAYLKIILENIDMAKKEKMPVCQDTGLSVFFVKQGCGTIVEAGKYKNIEGLINEGLKRGSKKGYLRNSVFDTLSRENTKDNAPGIIHLMAGQRNEFEILLMVKGFGSENKSTLKMLNPTEGKEGIEKFVIETVQTAGSAPCPPVFIGIGIGGSFEKAAVLSKFALCRIGRESPHRQWENGLKEKINALNIGAGGFGGKITAMDIRIETYPTHIAGLPVAVNISCWAHRFGSVKL